MPVVRGEEASIFEAGPTRAESPQARVAAVAWLAEHSSAKLWEGITVSKLVGGVSGEDFPTYVHKLGQNT